MTLRDAIKERGLKPGAVADQAGFLDDADKRRFYRIHAGAVPDAIEAGMIVAAINRLSPRDATIEEIWPPTTPAEQSK